MLSPKLMAAPRIVIDGIVPSVDGGRFAAKRIIGELVTVEADVFTDGHEVLVVELLWRAVDEKDWRRTEMRKVDVNDRCQKRCNSCLIATGRYEFTIEGWVDKYGTLCRDLQVKRAAGADVTVETAEAWQLLQKAKERTENGASSVVTAALEWLRDASVDTGGDILLIPDLRDGDAGSRRPRFSAIAAIRPFPLWRWNGRGRLYSAFGTSYFRVRPPIRPALLAATALLTMSFVLLPALRWRLRASQRSLFTADPPHRNDESAEGKNNALQRLGSDDLGQPRRNLKQQRRRPRRDPHPVFSAR